MIVWLVGFLVLAVAAAAVGWPAYRGRQSRQARDLNAERYLAWRGRARAGAGRSALDDLAEARERRRLLIAGALAAGAVVCLFAFFATGG